MSGSGIRLVIAGLAMSASAAVNLLLLSYNGTYNMYEMTWED